MRSAQDFNQTGKSRTNQRYQVTELNGQDGSNSWRLHGRRNSSRSSSSRDMLQQLQTGDETIMQRLSDLQQMNPSPRQHVPQQADSQQANFLEQMRTKYLDNADNVDPASGDQNDD